MDTLVFKEVSLGSQKLLEEIFLIYKEAFPLNEQQPISVLRNRLEQGKEVLIAAIQNDEVVGFGFLFDLKNTNFLLLDYLAVKKNRRGEKIGERLFEFLKQYSFSQNNHLLMEVDDPKYGEDKTSKCKRLAFYQKNGADWLNDVKYILPALDGTSPTEQILMTVTCNSQKYFYGNEVYELVKLLYQELYGIEENNDNFLEIVSSFGKKVFISPYQ